MLANLLAVSNESHFRERLYPLFLEKAGRELEPMGIVIGLLLAVEDYSSGMPTMKALVYLYFDRFIDAVTDDAAARAAAKAFFKEANSRK